jgi:hypothetical protein
VGEPSVHVQVQAVNSHGAGLSTAMLGQVQQVLAGDAISCWRLTARLQEQPNGAGDELRSFYERQLEKTIRWLRRSCIHQVELATKWGFSKYL